MTRRIALIAGFAAVVLALLAGLALIVTTPITIETCSAVQVEGGEFEETCTTDRERVWDDDDWLPISIVSAVAIGVSATAAAGAWLYVQRQRALGKAMLVAATTALVLLTFISLASIGLFFVPAALAAIIASVAAARTPSAAAT